MRVLERHALDYARAFNPDFPSEVAYWYSVLCPKAGVDARMAFAQMAKETNWWRFSGTARKEWNNPCGLGVTGVPDTGIRFSSIENGVRGHLGHLLCYFGLHDVEFCDYDPRHFQKGWTISKLRPVTAGEDGHLYLANDTTAMNGRWAVPGDGYGESIDLIAGRL